MRQDALAIFCALLARDPLPAQRFTDISTRLTQLAALACETARAFEGIAGTYEADPTAATAAAQRLWDYGAIRPDKEPPLPEKLRGGAAEPKDRL